MTLAAGSRLGPYEIISAIGAGGMGEVLLRGPVVEPRSRRRRWADSVLDYDASLSRPAANLCRRLEIRVW